MEWQGSTGTLTTAQVHTDADRRKRTLAHWGHERPHHALLHLSSTRGQCRQRSLPDSRSEEEGGWPDGCQGPGSRETAQPDAESTLRAAIGTRPAAAGCQPARDPQPPQPGGSRHPPEKGPCCAFLSGRYCVKTASNVSEPVLLSTPCSVCRRWS